MIKFDLNKGMENKGTSTFLKIILLSAFVIAAIVFIYFSFNGKHNKLPGGFENNIPPDLKNDTFNKVPDENKSIDKSNNFYIEKNDKIIIN
jgi:hypothetical protein